MIRFIYICLLFGILKFTAACHSQSAISNSENNLQLNSVATENQNLNANAVELSKYQEDFYRKGGKTSKADVIQKTDGELTTQDIIENRDKSIYISGGHFNCSFFHNKKSSQIKLKEKKARDFLWKYWKEKRRAYFSITYSSEDATSTGHIFIEPNERGLWRIIWRWVRHNNKVTDLPEIVAVEKVKNRVTKTDFGLQLRDKEGKVSRTFPDDFYGFED